MKAIKHLLALATVGAVMGISQPLSAGLYNFTTSDGGLTYTGGGNSLSQLIPDNTRAGVGYTINFGDSGVNIGSLSITLNISGGYNGDLYAYVSHGGVLVQLLNPNPAVSGSGMNITLGETGASLPAGGTGVLTGSYVSYGNLSAFNNMSAGGDWTVFFADQSPGDTATLNSFSLDITAVPEPVNVALVGFAGVLLSVVGLRRLVGRRGRAAS
jgi:hypothetical protein